MRTVETKLPDGFERYVDELQAEIETVEGYLAPNEISFLALAAACPVARGEILEIGSFKGKSTIILAKSAALNGDSIVHAVDPMIAPSSTDPDLRGEASSLPDFTANIRRHCVEDRIRLHQKFSAEVAGSWKQPLRLLWIDGDHTYRGTKTDFDGFSGHLADGAIIAIHDVLHEFEGGIRVFMEDILLSPNFGACGVVGSIAWAQFRADDSIGRVYREEKLSLYKRLSRLVPFLVFNESLSGFEKRRYKIFRSRIPHGPVDPQRWLALVGGQRSAGRA